MTTKKQPALYPFPYLVRPKARANRTILAASSAMILAGTGPLTWQYLRESDSDRQIRRPANAISVPTTMPTLSGTQAPDNNVPRFVITDVTKPLHDVIPMQMNSRGDVLGVSAVPAKPRVPKPIPVLPDGQPRPRREASYYELVFQRNGARTRIGLLPPIVTFHCASMNELGQVACVLRDDLPSPPEARSNKALPHGRLYLWQDGKCTDIGILEQLNPLTPSPSEIATLLQSDLYLNDAGNIAVSYRDVLLWSKGQWASLGLSMLCGLGAEGQVVGRPTLTRKQMDTTESLANLVFYNNDTKAQEAYSIGQETVLDVNETQGLITSRTYASMMDGRIRFSLWRDNRLTPIATVPASPPHAVS